MASFRGCVCHTLKDLRRRAKGENLLKVVLPLELSAHAVIAVRNAGIAVG